MTTKALARVAILALAFGLAILATQVRAVMADGTDAGRGSHRPATPTETLDHVIDVRIDLDQVREQRVGR